MKPVACLSKAGKRHFWLLWLVAGLGLFAAKNALAAEYYVATTGSDSNAGTLAAPFATLQKGADTAVAGDTVWIRGGTYKITTPKTSGAGIQLAKSGTSDTNRIKYWAYPGETPLFDFSNLAISTSGYTFGFVISGSWVHLKGIEECCVPMNSYANNGFASEGTNNIYELLNAHNNNGSGIQIGGGNQAINCDSHDNYDPTSPQGQGQNADGFGVHGQTSGPSTIIRGCRAWWNSDDGYDFINQEVPVTIENSWAFGAGFANYGTYRPTSGNGNGFKMGSSKTGIRHLIQNNVAWGNKANGFYANHSSGGNTWYNNTSFQNGTQYNMLASTWSAPNGGGTRTDGVILTGDKMHIMRNNIGYPNKNEYITGYGVDTAFNTWDLNITPKATDFLSITDPSVSGTGQAIETTSPALGPRQADGSLPNVDFLKLAAGSQMIDKGTNVQLPYVGAAPDLGAYEYGATGGTPTGGVIGAGGTTATGGATVTGGNTASGGATGTGGKTGSGGSTASGGKTGSGGATASGGKTGNGGTPATGGSPGTGGAVVLGGAPGTGGVVASAGTGETGGSVVAAGGDVSTGGAIDTGGISASSAAAGGSAVASAGNPATGGTPGTSAAGGTSSATGPAQASASGYSCRMAGAQTKSQPGWALLALLVFAIRLRKKR
jgi:hypothetical protein